MLKFHSPLSTTEAMLPINEPEEIVLIHDYFLRFIFKDNHEVQIVLLDDSEGDTVEDRKCTIQFTKFDNNVHARVIDIIDNQPNEFTAIFEPVE